MSSSAQFLRSGSDLSRLAGSFPVFDVLSYDSALSFSSLLAKPPGSLGVLEEIAARYVSWRGDLLVRRSDILLFAGRHGSVLSRGPLSAWTGEITDVMVENFRRGSAAINCLSRISGAHLSVIEPAGGVTVSDFTCESAMSESVCVRAFNDGALACFSAIDSGSDLIALGEMGIGNTAASSAMCAGSFGESASVWTGAGAGLDSEGVVRKVEAIDRGLALHGAASVGDPFECLRRMGGVEHAAMSGAICAARMRKVPVILDGFVCCASALIVLLSAGTGGLDHCFLGHLSAESAHGRLAERLGLRPILSLEMRLGEGSGAALAIPIVRAAVEAHHGMATLEEAGVAIGG